MDFEASMTRLEEIVSQLEQGDAPLEQAMALFEEGAKLLRECTKQLDQAEQKVTLLTADEDGQPEERPFPGEEPQWNRTISRPSWTRTGP
ncbi:MAG: exodeoxyribonuclease VII small subunit [Lawsonibacter sp.]